MGHDKNNNNQQNKGWKANSKDGNLLCVTLLLHVAMHNNMANSMLHKILLCGSLPRLVERFDERQSLATCDA